MWIHPALWPAISIHAPREGSDHGGRHADADSDISIHAPREGSDLMAIPFKQAARGFQSTLPVRGATTTTMSQNHQRL